MKYRHVIVALAVCAAAAFGPAYGETTQGQSVGTAIEQIASGLAGRIGFAAQEIGGDEVIAFNGDESFAMASTYKVAIAMTVLDRVDRGELSLDQLVEVPPDMFVTGVIALAETFPHPGIQLSVANLIEVMITESDNTATDVSMELAGGAAAVTEYLRNLGITDFRVDRTTREILMDFYGLSGATPEIVAEAISNNPALVAAQVDPNPDFEADPRDHATPLAML
jgi:beta-lactamase class A